MKFAVVRHCAFVLAWSGLAGGLFAQSNSAIRREGSRWVEEQVGATKAGSRLRVSSFGEVRVVGSNSDEISYRVVRKIRARNQQQAAEWLESASVTLAKQEGGTVVVSARPPQCDRCSFDAELEISAPIFTREAIVVTEGGGIEIRNLQGEVNAETTGGTIVLDVIGGSVRALTAGGPIDLGSIGGNVRCETVGGDVSLRHANGNATLNTSGGSIRAGRVGGLLRAETLGGSISVELAEGGVFAGTSGGSIRLGRVLGEVSASTAGGGIQVAEAPNGLHAETAAGDIRLSEVSGEIFAASAAGNIQAYFVSGQSLRDSLLETTGGSIVVFLPADLAITIEASVDLAGSLKRIRSEFSSIRVRRADDDFGPGSVVAEGQINGGGPVLRIVNTDGRIEIRQRH